MSSIQQLLTLCNQSACFALLDDASAEAQPAARLYLGLEKIITASDQQQFSELWQETEQALQCGRYAVAALSYETGAELYQIAKRPESGASRILIFSQKHELNQAERDEFLALQLQQAPYAGLHHLRSTTDFKQFSAAIQTIRDYIAAGDTYQVNYTFRWHASMYGNVLSLYARLRQRQPVPYGACLQFEDGSAIISCSPELFVRRQGQQLLTKPMKGTAAASQDESENQQRAAELAGDPKNRAENLMIVDLLRNDLGRIAETGSVEVSKLFEVQRYSQVLQMTSTVQAKITAGTSLASIMNALYPCGSITGAPKKRTMEIIREVESEARGVYTGALGWLEHTAANHIDLCFSVPIRTLQLSAPQPGEHGQMRKASFGVGAGIVYDSEAAAEWQECLLKARFLTQLPAPLSLLETMRVENQSCRLWPRHRQRLLDSARWFGIPLDQHSLDEAMQAQLQQIPPQQCWRLRLELAADGSLNWQLAALAAFDSQVKVCLATTRLDSNNPLARHKTSARAIYDQTWQYAQQHGCFDALLFNEREELVEGGRSNLILQIDGGYYTPALSSGLLPGVMRADLLSDPAWQLQEKVLYREDLHRASQIFLCNALRGVFKVDLITNN